MQLCVVRGQAIGWNVTVRLVVDEDPLFSFSEDEIGDAFCDDGCFFRCLDCGKRQLSMDDV